MPREPAAVAEVAKQQQRLTRTVRQKAIASAHAEETARYRAERNDPLTQLPPPKNERELFRRQARAAIHEAKLPEATATGYDSATKQVLSTIGQPGRARKDLPAVPEHMGAISQEEYQAIPSVARQHIERETAR